MAALTQQQLLTMLDRLFPVGYLEPIKEIGPGYEVFRAASAVGARVSTAIQQCEDDAQLLVAAGGSVASVSIDITRANGAAGDQTVKAGSLVRSPNGATYRLLVDAVFSGAATVALPNPTPAESVSQAYAFNQRGAFLAADGTLLPGDIDAFALQVLDPAFTLGAVPIEVTQASAATGGADAALDRLGLDRGLPRLLGETDTAYRIRLRSLPDTVSPSALRRAIDSLLVPKGITYEFIETFARSYQTSYDAVDPPVPFPVLPDQGAYDPTCFVYDDPRPATPFRGRYLDIKDYIAALIVVLPLFPPCRQHSFAYDDTAVDQTALTYLSGKRATGAWDLTGADPGVLLSCAFDGSLYNGLDPEAAALIAGLYKLLNQIKAGGVAVYFVLKGD